MDELRPWVGKNYGFYFLASEFGLPEEEFRESLDLVSRIEGAFSLLWDYYGLVRFGPCPFQSPESTVIWLV